MSSSGDGEGLSRIDRGADCAAFVLQRTTDIPALALSSLVPSCAGKVSGAVKGCPAVDLLFEVCVTGFLWEFEIDETKKEADT